jgi:hypothetical protein
MTHGGPAAILMDGSVFNPQHCMSKRLSVGAGWLTSSLTRSFLLTTHGWQKTQGFLPLVTTARIVIYNSWKEKCGKLQMYCSEFHGWGPESEELCSPVVVSETPETTESEDITLRFVTH